MHFALQSLLALFGKAALCVFTLVLSHGLIRMASAEISHLHLCRGHTSLTQTKYDTETGVNVIFVGRDLSEQKLEMESSDWRTCNSFFILKYKMIIN